MNDRTDQQLLRDYSERRSEAAFTELVRRHVDLVHSAAFRMTGEMHSAQDITQAVFVALAQNAARLTHHPVLSGWLHTTARNLAAKNVRAAVRRQNHEQEAVAMKELLTTAPDASWEEIAPHLDAALGELTEPERNAVLLRYFEKKSAAQMAERLGISDEAAQKRVNRAVERLREFFAKRGGSFGAGGLVPVISTNAVQAAPVGLAVTVSTAAVLAGIPIAATATATTAKAIALTTLKKAIIGATLVTAVGVGIYLHKSRQASVTPSAAAIPTIADDTPEPLRPTTLETAPSQLAEATTSTGNPQLSLTARELYERAEAHLREKRYDEALADMTKSIELLDQGIGRWEWFSDVYFSRSGLFAGKKDYTRAIADLTRLLEFTPKKYSAWFNRAVYFTELGRPDAAIADYTAIVEDPDTDFSSHGQPKEKCLASAYEYRGLIYQGRKEYDKAVVDFTESLRVDPSGGDGMIVYWRRGLLYQRLQQSDKALEDANQLSQWALQWAIAPDSKESDRDRAFTAARFGSEIFKHQLPFQLEVIAATRAKVGDFTEAVREQESAIKLLTPATEDQRPAMQARLDLYKAGTPLRGNR